jgi:hypothetical protein
MAISVLLADAVCFSDEARMRGISALMPVLFTMTGARPDRDAALEATRSPNHQRWLVARSGGKPEFYLTCGH